jgi:cephalosporin hydroxylase
MDLYQYFITQQGRNIIKNPHYFPIYERHFGRFVGHPITMFEIGTGEGGSCQMWKYYFGPMATIVTIDIARRPEFAENQIIVRTGDQSDPLFLNELIKEFGPPDIVLDDGSHMMDHINASFDVLFPKMSNKGVYLVEDLDGAYWPERGGGVGSPSSFIERSKKLIDEMNAGYTRGQITRGPFGHCILSISFYNSIVVIERTSSLNRELMRRPVPL